MKRTWIATAILAMTAMSTMAQRPSEEEMQQRRTEMTEKRADKLAKDFGLKDDAKAQFVATYKAYQDELATTQQQGRQRPEAKGERGEQAGKKQLTDEEATQKVQEYFQRQEEQIAQQQKRLEVEKKYYAEFQKTLTPQQLAKIFTQQRQRQGGQQRQGGFGGPQGGPRGGGFGGPGGGGFGGEF